MRYFTIELPARFTDFGRNLIEGLVSGIRSKLTAEREYHRVWRQYQKLV